MPLPGLELETRGRVRHSPVLAESWLHLDGACSMTVGKGRSERLILPRFSLGQTTFPLLPIPPFPHVLGVIAHCLDGSDAPPSAHTPVLHSCCTSTRSWGPTGLAGRRLGGSDSLCLSLSWFLAPLPLQVSLGLTLPPSERVRAPSPSLQKKQGREEVALTASCKKCPLPPASPPHLCSWQPNLQVHSNRRYPFHN